VALDPLATTADLAARNITIPSGMNADALLSSATDAVRDAAGCPISETTSAVGLVVDDHAWIGLPGGPVTAVASLSIDGAVIPESVQVNGTWSTGWRKVGDALLLNCVSLTLPATAAVTYTHGYATVPNDVVDLVCGLVAMAFQQDGDYAGAGRESSIRLGDYSESGKVPAGAESPSPIAIPDSVRQRLRDRFGTLTAVIQAR